MEKITVNRVYRVLEGLDKLMPVKFVNGELDLLVNERMINVLNFDQYSRLKKSYELEDKIREIEIQEDNLEHSMQRVKGDLRSTFHILFTDRDKLLGEKETLREGTKEIKRKNKAIECLQSQLAEIAVYSLGIPAERYVKEGLNYIAVTSEGVFRMNVLGLRLREYGTQPYESVKKHLFRGK